MKSCSRIEIRVAALSALVVAVVVCAFAATTAVAASQDEAILSIKARVVGALGISRATSDSIDIKVTRWTTPAERDELVQVLRKSGNTAVAAKLGEQEASGWTRFDPRGGGGPGRDPRKTVLRYAWEYTDGTTKDVILISDQYIGYGTNPQAADGSKLSVYPLSVVLLRLEQGDGGGWEGSGRIFVGCKIRVNNANGHFEIDEFSADPVYLKDVKVK